MQKWWVYHQSIAMSMGKMMMKHWILRCPIFKETQMLQVMGPACVRITTPWQSHQRLTTWRPLLVKTSDFIHDFTLETHLPGGCRALCLDCRMHAASASHPAWWWRASGCIHPRLDSAPAPRLLYVCVYFVAMQLCIYLVIYAHIISVHMCIYIYICVYICIYIYRERERYREGERKQCVYIYTYNIYIYTPIYMDTYIKI